MTNRNSWLQPQLHAHPAAAAALTWALLATVAVLSGCSGDSKPAAPAGQPLPLLAAKPVAAPAVNGASARPLSLVKAVSADKSAAAVDLHFELPARPELGVSFPVELVFSPRTPAEALDVEVVGMEGLTLQGQDRFRFDNVHAGQQYRAKVALQSTVPGMYYVSIVARATSQATTEARTFSVPVVVGPVGAVTQKPAPERDSRGQAVERMEAKEPKS